MALDAGNAPEEFRAHPDWRDPVPSIADAPSLGVGLRRAREVSGKSLAQLSAITRVPQKYLTALEQGEHSALPSRVFTLGYVRAYAGALGLDEQLAVERYKREAPDGDKIAPLQPPAGVAFAEVRRHSPRVIAAVAALVIAVVGWNVFQRVSHMRSPPPAVISETPESWTLGAVPGQTQGLTEISLDVPRPAPPDQTVPVMYLTPGLEAELLGLDPADADAAAALADATSRRDAPVQAAFNPRGAVYGAAAADSQVTLQARRPTSLVVRLSDGRVLFARQLAAGEAWRAPIGVPATIDASEPALIGVYLNGESDGALPGQLTPLNQLNARAATLARQAQAQAEAEARAEAARRAAAAAAEAPAAGPALTPTATPTTTPAAPLPAGAAPSPATPAAG
ncbi:MAG TPA: helix-turn-helix domain-containing protein [Brevundimonas sp.]|jgi:transcriptional regulator with XRE-family HTH domain|uniref:helix-turn-helix domain-containing protein n=1 Tax=Brevundimonas sp. TaxID=1871086 RepID=UPI002E12FA26|nr:helix-turn-helix domain-containing protein [Brevundimonas sp.]